MAPPRYAEKFTSADGSSIVFTFPLNLYEWEPSPQPLLSPFAAMSGAHYGYRQLGSGLAVKQNAVETVRCTVFGTSVEIEDKLVEARQKLYRAGRGKLWLLDSTADRWWAWAEAAAIPGFRLGMYPYSTPLALPFTRFSHWYNDTPAAADVTLNANPTTFSINNTGNAKVYNAIFIFKGTYVDPELTNSTNSYILESSRDGSNANHWLRFDCGKRRAEFSSNGGTSYSGDYASFVRQTAQVHFMVLEPGTNNFSCAFGGVPSGTLSYSFYPAYH